MAVWEELKPAQLSLKHYLSVSINNRFPHESILLMLCKCFDKYILQIHTCHDQAENALCEMCLRQNKPYKTFYLNVKLIMAKHAITVTQNIGHGHF